MSSSAAGPGQCERNCPHDIASGLSSDGRPLELVVAIERELDHPRAHRRTRCRRGPEGSAGTSLGAASRCRRASSDLDPGSSRRERRSLARAGAVAPPAPDVSTDGPLLSADHLLVARACACARRARGDARATLSANAAARAPQIDGESDAARTTRLDSRPHARDGAPVTRREPDADVGAVQCDHPAGRAALRWVRPRVLLTLPGGARQPSAGSLSEPRR